MIFVGACGDLAPTDAVVSGPADSSSTFPGAQVPQTTIFRALDFTVTNSQGIPLPDVEIEFFAGGSGILTDLDGNALNAASPGIFKTHTDDRGVGRVSFLMTLPPCTDATDKTASGSVRGTVANADHLWVATITVICS